MDPYHTMEGPRMYLPDHMTVGFRLGEHRRSSVFVSLCPEGRDPKVWSLRVCSEFTRMPITPSASNVISVRCPDEYL